MCGSSSRRRAPGMSSRSRRPHSEVRVVLAPHDQGRVVESPQPGQRAGGGPVVGGVELPGQEPAGLRAAAGVGEVGGDVPVKQLGGQDGRVADRLAAA